jgi:hypothetical protein
MGIDPWRLLYERLAATNPGLRPQAGPTWPLPAGMARGSEPHLVYLTLVYTLSGGRDQVQLWTAARQTVTADPKLFDPHYLAYAKPTTLIGRLQEAGLTQKTISEATIWQRTGQALVMRAKGSVARLLADHDYDAPWLLAMLQQNKTTFPVLSGAQTAPRWLYGLAAVGLQPLTGAGQLLVPVSPPIRRKLAQLSLEATWLPVELFELLALWPAQPRHGVPGHSADGELSDRD